MAPHYSDFPDKYRFRAWFLLVPLHFLYVWVLVITLSTAKGGFCTQTSSYPKVLLIDNGLYFLVALSILVLRSINFLTDTSVT